MRVVIKNDIVGTDRMFIGTNTDPQNEMIRKQQIFRSAVKYKKRKSPSTPMKFLLNNEEGMMNPKHADIINTALNLRKDRIRKIYESVLCKAGQQSAKHLYQEYFANKNCVLTVDNLERELAEKKIREAKSNMKLLQPVGKKDRSKSVGRPPRSRITTPSASPSDRLKRIESYGKWYLRPNGSNSKFAATDTGFMAFKSYKNN